MNLIVEKKLPSLICLHQFPHTQITSSKYPARINGVISLNKNVNGKNYTIYQIALVIADFF